LGGHVAGRAVDEPVEHPEVTPLDRPQEVVGELVADYGDELGPFDQLQEPAREHDMRLTRQRDDEGVRSLRRPVLGLIQRDGIVDPKTFGSQRRGIHELPVRGSVETVGGSEQLPAGLLGQVASAGRAGEERPQLRLARPEQIPHCAQVAGGRQRRQRSSANHFGHPPPPRSTRPSDQKDARIDYRPPQVET
jgi:hypothetical protein